MLNNLKTLAKQGIEIFFCVMCVVFVAAIVFGLMNTATNLHAKWGCENYAEASGEKTIYIWFDDCYVPRREEVREIYNDTFSGKYERHF